MTKPIKLQHGRRVLTFTHDVRANTNCYILTDGTMRVQLEQLKNGNWIAGRWAWLPEQKSWDFIQRLRNRSGRYNNKCAERKDPRALAKAAAARWCSTGE
jgi:hypothetical protein